MFRWYVVNTYSGHENKVKHNLEHRVVSLGQQRAVRQVVVPTETVSEMKDNQKVHRREAHHARLRAGQHGAQRGLLAAGQGHARASPASSALQRARAAHPDRGRPAAAQGGRRRRSRTQAQFAIGESVKVVSGPLSDFSGEISEINQDAAKLKVLVSIFGRETPVEVGFDQVKKI